MTVVSNVSIDSKDLDITNSYRYVIKEIQKHFGLDDERQIKIVEDVETLEEKVFYKQQFVGFVDEVLNKF